MKLPSALICMFLLAASLSRAALPAVELTVRLDAREIDRRVVHTQMVLAAKPGSLTLVYPKWIPAQHAPGGPLDSIIGLEIQANGTRLSWSRNPVDMYAITVQVPTGVDHLDINIESGLPIGGTAFANSPDSSSRLAIIRWNQYVLLPKGRDAADISTRAVLMPPAQWRVACALESHTGVDGAVEFEPASLMQLIDSPAQIGRFTRTVEVPGSAPGTGIAHRIEIAADSAEALEVPADFSKGYASLVAEAGALFDSRLYRHYTWLLSLSDHIAHFGEEHHESSDDRSDEKALIEADRRKGVAELLAHEYTHSWNGKYRRPRGLLSPDYQTPMDGSLLWVYEGLTQFWGEFLPARAGLYSNEDLRDTIAVMAGHFDVSAGVKWRPLADTAVEAQVLYDAPAAWESARRGVDFYDGSVFLWLDVDAELRERSAGNVSLDDFMKRFFSGASGRPALKPYAESQVYEALVAIAPGEWRSLVRRHLDVPGTAAMFSSLQRSGWRLVYSAEKNSTVELGQKRDKSTNRQWSIGLQIDEKGVIVDTTEGRAAALAGAGPGMTLVAVNGRRFTPDILDAAILAAQHARQPIELLLESSDYFRTVKVPYYDGPRFPHLMRIADRPDTLSILMKARTR